MNIGFSYLTGILTYLVLLFFFVGYKIVKNNATFKEYLSKENIIRFSIYLVLLTTFLLLIHLRFDDVQFLHVLYLSICTSIIIVLIPVDAFISKLMAHEIKKDGVLKTIGFLGTITFLILEVALYSNIGYGKNDNAAIIPFDSPLIVETSGIQKDSYLELEAGDHIIIDNKNAQFDYYYFNVNHEREVTLGIAILVSDNLGENFIEKAYFEFDSVADNFKYFNTKNTKDYRYIKFDFYVSSNNFYYKEYLGVMQLRQIVGNKAFPFIFNTFRFLICTGLLVSALLIIKNAKNWRFKEISSLKSLQKTIIAFSIIALFVLIINSVAFKDQHYILTSEISGTHPNIYYQLFDAFRKGQVYLDVTPSAELLALENPYDPEQRAGVYYLWDHVLYNGKYYCYYGAAPVILVMFPIYFLTGMQYTATTLFVEEIGTLFSVMAFLLLSIEFIKVLVKRINIASLVAILVAGVFSSLLISNTIFKLGYYSEQIYRVPYSYGLLFMFLMFYFFLKAYQNQKGRMGYLFLGGLSVVLMVASRPTMIVSFILTIPLLIKVLLEKYPLKKKIVDLIPMITIVGAGAALLMVYNYVRYNSILEFGQSYQLTVMDNTHLHYDIKGLIPTIADFYLNPAYFSNYFPHIQYGYYEIAERFHVFYNGGIGLMFFPLFWSMFLLPFAFKKEDDMYIRIIFYMSPFVVFLLAFTTYCFAGYCARYMVEITGLSAVIAVVTAIKLIDKYYERFPKLLSVIVPLVVVSSTLVSFNVLFLSYDGWREADMFGLLEVMRTMFNNYNIPSIFF